MLFRVQVFQSPGFSVSGFFWVQDFQGPGFSGSGSRVWVKVLEVAHFLLLTLMVASKMRLRFQKSKNCNALEKKLYDETNRKC